MDRLARMEVRRLRLGGGGEVAAFVAAGLRARLMGLAGLPGAPTGMALLIPRCRAVHTFGMRFRLDVLFVTVEGDRVTVHEVHRGVRPGRLVRASRAARAYHGLAALELPASGGRVR
jgi:hypothetical protein